MKPYKIILILLFFSLLSNKAFANLETEADHAIIQDHFSGEILYEKDADEKIYPASMTKIMTAIVAFDLLKKGETSLDEMITISEKAWRMSQSGYSSMFIMLNDQVSVEDLLKGIIIVSGNDACVALAEGLSGSEEDFVALMNEKSEELGLTNTNFNNSSGINDPSITTVSSREAPGLDHTTSPSQTSADEHIIKLSPAMQEQAPSHEGEHLWK